MKRSKRLFCLLLTVLMAVTSLTLAQPVQAVTQKDIDKLKNNATDLAAQKKELQTKISDLSDDISNTMKKKTLLDQQVAILSDQIGNVEDQINTYAALITQTEAELSDAEAKEQAQYELFCKRVRAMEERGTVSYWSVLFNATNFTDLLGRLDAVNEVMDADQAVINQLQTLQDEITAKQETLKSQKADSEAAKADLVSKKSELDTQRTAANKLVQQLSASKGEYESDMDDLAAEEEAVQDRIMELSRQLAAQQAAQGQTSNVALGGYIWPVNSHYVTSTFGGRSSPGGIGSTNHKGVDIGRVGYTTDIHAAKAGTVIISQYSTSYGNYVVVSHGSGNTTLYAHMSSRSVSAGQKVAQGDKLGVTGSTGHSTGPHLHFEISENGVRINPLKYLTNYTLAG